MQIQVGSRSAILLNIKPTRRIPYGMLGAAAAACCCCFRSTPPALEKWKTKWNSNFSSSAPFVQPRNRRNSTNLPHTKMALRVTNFSIITSDDEADLYPPVELYGVPVIDDMEDVEEDADFMDEEEDTIDLLNAAAGGMMDDDIDDEDPVMIEEDPDDEDEDPEMDPEMDPENEDMEDEDPEIDGEDLEPDEEDQDIADGELEIAEEAHPILSPSPPPHPDSPMIPSSNDASPTHSPLFGEPSSPHPSSPVPVTTTTIPTTTTMPSTVPPMPFPTTLPYAHFLHGDPYRPPYATHQYPPYHEPHYHLDPTASSSHHPPPRPVLHRYSQPVHLSWEWMPDFLAQSRRLEGIPILPETVYPCAPTPLMTREPVHHTIPVLVTLLRSHERLLRECRRQQSDNHRALMEEIDAIRYQLTRLDKENQDLRETIDTLSDVSGQQCMDIDEISGRIHRCEHQDRVRGRELSVMRERMMQFDGLETDIDRMIALLEDNNE